MNGWRAGVLRLMRVPPRPAPPPGAPPRIFRASPRYFSFRLLLWWIGHVSVVVSLIAVDVALAGQVSEYGSRGASALIKGISAFGIVVLLLRLTLGYVLMRLDYELRWYMISDRAIRIRDGVVTVREKTIALANIQNTVVKQGPLQRLFGIADVEVTTAGGGSSSSEHQGKKSAGEPMHVGIFRGVDNAHEIRTIILEAVRRHRDSGLGDPDDGDETDSAARLLREVRLTREMLQAR